MARGRSAPRPVAQRILLRGGIAIGVTGALVAMIVGSGDRSGLREVIALGVIVSAIFATVPIYDVEHWSLRRRTVVHSAVMACTVLPALLLSGWVDLSRPSTILIALLGYAGGGVVLWTVGYLLNRPPRGARAEPGPVVDRT